MNVTRSSPSPLLGGEVRCGGHANARGLLVRSIALVIASSDA